MEANSGDDTPRASSRTPDYEKYSVEQLWDAYRWIDKDRFPARARKIEQEIEKRRAQSGHAKGADDGATLGTTVREQPASAKRRGVAFLLDVMAITVVWGAADNLVAPPAPEPAMALAHYLVFCLYFVLRDKPGGASFGKGLLGLRVQRLDGQPVSSPQVLLRTAILAAPLFLAGSGLMDPALRNVPVLFTHALAGLFLGVLLYSIVLLWTPSGRMLHDRMARTRVLHATEVAADVAGRPQPALAPAPLLERPAVAGLALMGSTIAAAILLVSTHASLGLSELAKIPAHRFRGPNTFAQQAIEDELHLRTRVEIKETWTRRWGAEASSERGLEVKVWLPFVSWNAQNRDHVAKVVLENLKIRPGYFDTGTINLWTGAQFLHFGVSHTLNLPES